MKSVKIELVVAVLSINTCLMRTNLASKAAETTEIMEALCEKYGWMSYAEVENAFCDDGVNPDFIDLSTDFTQQMQDIIKNCIYNRKCF